MYTPEKFGILHHGLAGLRVDGETALRERPNLPASSVVVREITLFTNDLAKPVVPALVDAVVARPTDHDTIPEVTGTAGLHMLDVMSLGAFTKSVIHTTCFTNLENRRATRSARVLLSRQC